MYPVSTGYVVSFKTKSSDVLSPGSPSDIYIAGGYEFMKALLGSDGHTCDNFRRGIAKYIREHAALTIESTLKEVLL